MFLAIPFLALLVLGVACAALGCDVPAAAISAVAALNLPRRLASIVIGLVWVLDQAIGFGFKHYPQDASTFAWAIGLGVAAFAAYGIARTVAARPVVAFLAAFVALEAVLVLFSIKLGGWEAYAPRWMAQIFAVNLAWFVGAQVTLRLLARKPLFGDAAA